MKRAIILFTLASLLLTASVVFADTQEKAQIKLQAVVEKDVEVIKEDGTKEIQRVEAAKVIPGDEVIYSIHYSHVGNEPAENVLITNPIPEHMVYINNSAEGEHSSIEFSIDNGQTFDIPENLKVSDASGNLVTASANNYTHVRWTLTSKVLPGNSGFVSFRAQLE